MGPTLGGPLEIGREVSFSFNLLNSVLVPDGFNSESLKLSLSMMGKMSYSINCVNRSVMLTECISEQKSICTLISDPRASEKTSSLVYRRVLLPRRKYKIDALSQIEILRVQIKKSLGVWLHFHNAVVLKGRFRATREESFYSGRSLPSVEIIARTEKKPKENKGYYRRGYHRSHSQKQNEVDRIRKFPME